MPFASEEMTTKLAKDFLAAGKLIEGMQEFLKMASDSPSKGAIGTLQKSFDNYKPQIVKFAAGLKKKPPVFPDEVDYKKRRKDVTKLIGAVEKTAKTVNKEKEVLKNQVTVTAVSSAKSELVGKDKSIAQALTMVARGEKGRTGPKEEGVKKYNHIHIGGNAQSNLLFQPGNKTVLGTLDFHLESGLPKGRVKQIKNVAGRSGSKITLVINGDIVTVKK